MSRLVIEHTTNGLPVCYVALRVAKAIISEVTAHAAANVFDLLVKTLVVSKKSLFLDSRLMTSLYDPLKPYGIRF